MTVYFVECENLTESMSERWTAKFESAEDLERWFLYDKGFTIVHGVWKAEPVSVRAVTEPDVRVVGYEVTP